MVLRNEGARVWTGTWLSGLKHAWCCKGDCLGELMIYTSEFLTPLVCFRATMDWVRVRVRPIPIPNPEALDCQLKHARRKERTVESLNEGSIVSKVMPYQA